MKSLFRSTCAFMLAIMIASMLAACSAGASALALAPAPALGTATKAVRETALGQPNIVFILTDDLDAAEIQYMPKLKALVAANGVTFPNYFVPESLCCPSRATTLRGQYPHNTGVLNNQPPDGGFQKFFSMGEEKSTIAVWLQQAGYRTMLAGKYLNGYPDKSNPLYIPPGWSEWYSPVKGNPYSEYNYSLNENGKQVDYGSTSQDYGTDVYMGKAIDFIQRSAKSGTPFFAYVAPYAPHAPYTPAPRHASLFPLMKAPHPPNYNEADVSDKPAYIRNRSLLTQRQMTAIDMAYRKRLQALQAVDEGIASIVKTLKDSRQLDNTYIFFTSDNGYHLGNHRQVLGKIAPYEEELRVTMLVRGPGVPAGKTLEHLTGNVDLAPTWAELAGAKAADFCDGRSLVPLLGKNPPPLNKWRQAFSLEWGPYQVDQLTLQQTPAGTVEPENLEPLDQDETDATALPAAKQKSQAIPFFRGVRLQTLSYVEYNTGEIELYNIKNDPYQLNNLASTADPKLLQQFAQRVKQLATCKAAGCRTIEDAPFKLAGSLAPAATSASPSTGVSTRGVSTPGVSKTGVPTPGLEPSYVPTAPASAPVSTPASSGATAFTPGFFGMTAMNASDYPPLSFGVLGHPGIGAWPWIERQKGVYDFNLMDAYVNAASAHGLLDQSSNTASMAITLGFTPQWYAANPASCKLNQPLNVTQCTSAPAHIQDWTNYIKAVMAHYNGVIMPHIRYYELWNEMNINLFWTGSNNDLVKLAQAAYPIIHADPNSLLLTPSVAGPVGTAAKASGSVWMAAYLDAGGAKYADGGAFHGYIAQEVTPFPMPEQDTTLGCVASKSCYGSIITKVKTMRQVFDQHGMAGKPMFDTEGSWGKGNVTDPDTQVAWLARWLLLQAGLRSSANLQMVTWFSWSKPDFNWGSIEDKSGQPTRAGLAFSQVYGWLVGASMGQPCSATSGGIWTCALTRPGGYRALAVWSASGSQSYKPSGATYVQYRDLAGNTTKIASGGIVPVGALPVLVETAR